MAALREITREWADEIREGIAWVLVYRTGRAWHALAVWSNLFDESFETDDLNEALEILKLDPDAVALNGYYCGHFGEDMNVDQLAAGIRWHYENQYNRLADRDDIQQAQEAITMRAKIAEAAGLPFRSRLSAGAGDEPDPYFYDGSMSPEDYEAATAEEARDRAATEALRAAFPDVDEDVVQQAAGQLDRASPGMTTEQLTEAIEAVNRILAAIADTVRRVVEAVVAMAERIAKTFAPMIRELDKNAASWHDAMLRAAAPGPKWWHYYKHAKKARVRKKYRRRLEAALTAALSEKEVPQNA